MTAHLGRVCEAVLGPDGSCATYMEHFAVRPEQVEYARRVAGLLEKQAEPGRPKVALLQGSTGVGKTLGYLVPLLAYAIKNEARVAIATHSIDLLLTLPKQVEIAKASLLAADMDARGVEQLTIATRMGRAEYVSHLAVQALIDETPSTDAALLASLNSLLQHAKTVGIFRCWDGEVPDGLDVRRLMLSGDSDAEDQEVYMRDMARAASSRVLLCTQASVILATFGQSTTMQFNGEPPIDALVIDEADAFSGMAETVTRNYVPLRELAASFEALGNAEAALKAVHKLSESIEKVLDTDERSFLSARSDSLTRGVIANLIEKVRAAGAVAIKGRRKPLLTRAISMDLWLLGRSGKALSGGAQYGLPYLRRSSSRGYSGVGMGDPSPGQILGKLLANPERQSLRHVLLTSATLTPVAGERLDAFARQVGLRDHGYEQDVSGAIEPEQFGKLKFVFSAPDLAHPFDKDAVHTRINPAWLQHVVRVIREASSEKGRILVLVPAYDDGQLIQPLLSGLDRPTLVQTREPGHRAKCLEAFIQSKDAIWISPTSWEGLDLPGMIKHLVIGRLPYPNFESDVLVARRQMYLRMGRTEEQAMGVIHQVAREACLRKLAQGLGRPIRSAADSATIWFADPRMGLPSILAEEMLESGQITKLPTRRGFLEVIPRRHLDGIRRPGRARAITRPLETA